MAECAHPLILFLKHNSFFVGDYFLIQFVHSFLILLLLLFFPSVFLILTISGKKEEKEKRRREKEA